MSRFRTRLAPLVGVLLIAGCSAATGPEVPPADTPAQALTAMPDGQTTVVDGTGAVELAVATSRAIYLSAPGVVLVGEGDTEAIEHSGAVAVTLGVPVLVTPAPVEPAPTEPGQSASPAVAPVDLPSTVQTRAEIERLGARWVLTSGALAGDWARTAALPPGVAITAAEGDVPGEPAPPAPLSSLLVLAQGNAVDAAAVATAQAAGTRVLLLGSADPRATSASVQAVAGTGPIETVLALGSAFGSAERLRQRLSTAATGVELPGGGQVVFPGRRMVALYGHPGDPGLGVLGEQPVDAAIVRAQQLAASYQAFVGEPVVPAFEIIVTVAAGATGSNVHPMEKFRPWVEAARNAGVYVVLDLQPGDAHFLAQARLYEELLRYPNVGLALDPEWRVQPGHQHMVQIGSVDAAEINEVGQWLAQLTRDHHLPQKVFMLHQFTLGMISSRPALVTDYDDLRVVIHADGFGSPGAKHNTWNTLHLDAPANIGWGWKNFYDEDRPTFTPQETVNVSPEIVFVSYQ
jgi:hypothetical protein